jgi:anti-sigma regulatory factor (Ser/Thr protein kinase)
MVGVMKEPDTQTGSVSRYRHEAILYAGRDAFGDAVAPFIVAALRSNEPILAAVSEAKIQSLRAALGKDADGVHFVDIASEGKNPARIIPLWQSFLDEYRSADRVRGVGEPIWPERPRDELVESERHEALLNVAFPPSVPFWLVCPYDREALDGEVLDEALRNHPFLSDPSGSRASATYRGYSSIAEVFGPPLPEPRDRFDDMTFREDLADLRAFTAERARGHGLSDFAVEELVLAVDEVAANSIRYGGGEGTIRIWREGERVLCDVRDRGRIEEPLVGRVRPTETQTSGFGLWLANQLCDLVQIRTSNSGSIVRLHKVRG